MCISTLFILLESSDIPASMTQSIVCPHCDDPDNATIFQVDDLLKYASNGIFITRCSATVINMETIAPDLVLGDVTTERVDFGTIEMSKEIGKGAFGTIYMGYYHDNPVAIKVLWQLIFTIDFRC